MAGSRRGFRCLNSAGKTRLMRTLTDSRAQLGECPVWDDRSQRLFWIDIEAGRLFAASLAGEHVDWTLPERIGSFGLTTETDVVVMALETGFALFNLRTGEVERISMRHELGPAVRFNDGKCDADGNFWAGTMSEAQPRRPDGALYRLSPDLTVDVMRRDIRVSNSLAWSLDGSRLYFADSPEKTILCYGGEAATGALGQPDVIVSPDIFRGVPDGLTVDAADDLWTAEWDGWRVLVHDAAGLMVKQIDVPVSRPTSCCFGGPDLTTLFITTARDDAAGSGSAAFDLAGKVLVIDAAGHGVPAARFRM